MTRSIPDWGDLQIAISGDVILPGSPDYESARKPAIARFHVVRPQAVVRCESPEDVSMTISFARQFGLKTATRSGGHSFAGHSSTEGVVIDVTPMHSVSVSDDVTIIGAGARLGDVYDALNEYDRTIPAGNGPTVGIAGLTLGGGLGILGRTHGLTADHLLGAQVVLADGRVLYCDDHQHKGLFWALRGAGGGNFGVVTSLVFDTLPAPAATSFHLVWPHTHAVPVIDAWQTWASTAPDGLAASLLVTAAGNVEKPPMVNLFGAMLGTEADTAELLDELVALVGATPVSAFREHMSYRETKQYLAELGDTMVNDGAEETSQTQQSRSFSKSEFFRRPLPTDAIETLIENLTEERVQTESRELDFTPWGGAYNRVPEDATAFVHRDERFLLKDAVSVEPNASAAERESARRWLSRSWATVHPWGTGGVYPNFPDPDLDDWAHAYYGTNYDRLVRVKARYDPTNFFCSSQPILNNRKC